LAISGNGVNIEAVMLIKAAIMLRSEKENDEI